MRILVTGTKGQVVTALRDHTGKQGHDLLLMGRPEYDFNQPDSLYTNAVSVAPDVIMSVAAYTAVDKAESEPDLAHLINVSVPAALAAAARDLDIPILHVSTDYVYAGDKDTPYLETDPPHPASVYGLTKLAGEQAVSQATPNHVILRTAWVYSPYGQNFVRTMLRLAESRDEISVVADQYGCPTSADEIAQALLAIAEQITQSRADKLRGTFHLAAKGETNWASFAEAIFVGATKRGAKGAKVISIPSTAYPTAARRPTNSRLNTEKLHQTYGIELQPWEKSLESCLDKLILPQNTFQ